jgi:hypothetical protein
VTGVVPSGHSVGIVIGAAVGAGGIGVHWPFTCKYPGTHMHAPFSMVVGHGLPSTCIEFSGHEHETGWDVGALLGVGTVLIAGCDVEIFVGVGTVLIAGCDVGIFVGVGTVLITGCDVGTLVGVGTVLITGCDVG